MPESVTITCPKCNSQLPVSGNLLSPGSKIRCGGCNAVINPLREHKKKDSGGAGSSFNVDNLSEFDEGARAVAGGGYYGGGLSYDRGGVAPPANKAYFAPAIFILVLVLGAQLLWVNKNTWSQRSVFQPVYEFVCTRFSNFCSISDLVETKVQIHGLSREMGEIPGSVVIAGALINHDPSPAPFPRLFVRFSDLDERVVASGIFEYNTYLAQPVANNFMTSQQPYKFQINISSGGREQLNPSLNFEAQLLRRVGG